MVQLPRIDTSGIVSDNTIKLPTYATVLAAVTILVFPWEDLVIFADSDQYGISIAVKHIPHSI